MIDVLLDKLPKDEIESKSLWTRIAVKTTLLVMIYNILLVCLSMGCFNQ